MFFDSFDKLLRIILVGPLTYFILIFILRLSGKRVLSKLNMFDFIVTVALGSTVSSIIISADVSLSEGMLVLVILTSLQFIITWLSMRLPVIRSIITSTPTMVFFQGNFLPDNMQKMRLSQTEVLSAIRNHGIGDLRDVGSVILETDGSLSVISQEKLRDFSSLKNVDK